MARKTFQVGDRVNWKNGGGTTEGKVVEIAFESGRIGDFVDDASGEAPRFIIETDEGKRAAPRWEALSRSQSGQA